MKPAAPKRTREVGRLHQLPQRLTAIRNLIQQFVETTFADVSKNGCPFPF
jgi:hypothetical protein